MSDKPEEIDPGVVEHVIAIRDRFGVRGLRDADALIRKEIKRLSEMKELTPEAEEKFDRLRIRLRDARDRLRRDRDSGSPSTASSIRRMFHSPGVHVVARVPSAGPVPPPIMVVMPLEIAS